MTIAPTTAAAGAAAAPDVDFLASLPLFHSLSIAEMKKLAPCFESDAKKAGELIYAPGATRDRLRVVLLGRVELQTEHADTDEWMTQFGPGQFMNESALLQDDGLHSAKAIAVQDTQFLVLRRARFVDFAKENPLAAGKIQLAIGSFLAQRLSEGRPAAHLSALYSSGKYRTEKDLLGTKEVKAEAYYGIQTLRATENFNITGVTLQRFPVFIRALAEVKKAAAIANFRLGLLPEKKCDAICLACDEISSGHWHDQFVVDMVQGGAGTSTNMNANEVIANRGLELLGHKRGEYAKLHPNNDVNLSQSTNDAYPTAVRIATLHSVPTLTTALFELCTALGEKAKEFADVIKMGRTQLQDAVPMTLGQEFEAFRITLEEDIERIRGGSLLFLEVNMGGTAIGTGINADKRYRGEVIRALREVSGFPVVTCANLIEATPDMGSFILFSGLLKRLAVKLSKICNDLRLLSSGPRCGLHEIDLPPMQPGSSIMPGKVNPVIPEVVNQVAFQVVGNDLTITMAAEAGQLQLNVMEPVIVFNLFQSVQILTQAIRTLSRWCIKGIKANRDVCRHYVEHSIGLVTALNPYIGYEQATAIAKEALETGESVATLALRKGLVSREKLDDILRPENMV